MKQTQLDKHTIAWFKIAECVSRGEKERALGVYRLLSHSFNDSAVARQLEADIYLAFGEKEFSIPLYYQAMELYQKSNRLLEAVAICEHLISMAPHDISWRREAIRLYYVLDNKIKLYGHIEKSLDMLVIGQDYVLQEFLSMLQQYSFELYEYGCLYIQKN